MGKRGANTSREFSSFWQGESRDGVLDRYLDTPGLRPGLVECNLSQTQNHLLRLALYIKTIA